MRSGPAAVDKRPEMTSDDKDKPGVSVRRPGDRRVDEVTNAPWTRKHDDPRVPRSR